MNTKFIDKLAYIDIQDKKVLVTRSQGKDTWYIPGGKREAGESDIQALTREIKEELDVELIPSTIQYFGTFEAQAHGKPEGTLVRMTCYFAKFIGKLTPSAEIAQFEYFGYRQKDKTSPVNFLIFDDLRKKGLIE